MSLVTQIQVAICYLMYIGARDFKHDNVCGTGTVWHGYGDVQPVDKKHLPKFLLHPDVWVEVDGPDAKPKQKLALVNEKDQQDQDPESGNDDDDPDDSKKLNDNPGGAFGADLSAVKNAILSLDASNPKLYAKDGTPRLPAVRDALGGDNVTEDDIKQAWAELKAASV
jgi:hypothetical protein